jgi:hypothetical protein
VKVCLTQRRKDVPRFERFSFAPLRENVFLNARLHKCSDYFLWKAAGHFGRRSVGLKGGEYLFVNATKPAIGHDCDNVSFTQLRQYMRDDLIGAR